MAGGEKSVSLIDTRQTTVKSSVDMSDSVKLLTAD